jgi:glucose-1-phosphate cytidylyltransferase
VTGATVVRALPDPADIPVVILAGGMGTRLREETENVPKPLVTIGEQPMLWHIMKLYGHHGFRRFVVCLGYKGWLIKDYFLNFRERHGDVTLDLSGDSAPTVHDHAGEEDWEVTLAETGLHTGTGGRLGRVRRYVEEADTICFTYGDGIGAVDLTAELAFHASHDRIGTVAGVHPTSRYGEMRVDTDHNVLEFNEKPTRPEGFVSGGFFVFQRGIFDYVTGDEGLFFEKEPLRRLARDEQLAVYEHDGYWLGMDTYRDFTELNDLWRTGAAPWKVWT